MSYLSDKSMQNFAAFGLYSDKFHAPAVHCAYYSCFQKLCAYLKEEQPEGYAVVEERWKDGRGKHGGIIDLASITLRAFDRDDAKTIKTKLTELKNFRVISDYHDEEVTKADVQKVKDLLSGINQILKRRLGC